MNKMYIKLLSITGLIYAILLIYASLMPFNFSFSLNVNNRVAYLFSYWPINLHARISGSDLVSNLVLYIPLGWIIATRFRLNKIRWLSSMVAAGLICSIISVSVESLQFFIISRVASASDWLLNTISGCTGAVIGALYGKRLWLNGIKWLQLNWETRPIIIATVIFSGLLMLDSFSPYLPTILLKQVWHSIKNSHFNIAQGIAAHPWHWWIVQRFFVYLFLTLLISGCIKQRPIIKKYIYAASFSVCFAFFLEIGKLFIVSRSFNIANILTSWAGCFFAVVVGIMFNGTVSTEKKLDLSICFILLYLFYLAWFPFNFTWNYMRMKKVWPSPIRLLPLYDYAMEATLNHARLFMQSIFLLGILIYILRIRFHWFENHRTGIWYAAFFCGFLGFLQEGGQMFLATRTPSATDIYCFALGGSIGAWIKRPSMPK